jgi:hypothetical protein
MSNVVIARPLQTATLYFHGRAERGPPIRPGGQYGQILDGIKLEGNLASAARIGIYIHLAFSMSTGRGG